ncbi:hypothetical protein AB0D99_19450 [Streptomyces sp. NPDC047971]|uniref:hypothetical protein n=1 Tax=Streptomyces sp. NPDC047971 TaxID=3154499 RepID=UPI0033E664F1
MSSDDKGPDDMGPDATSGRPEERRDGMEHGSVHDGPDSAASGGAATGGEMTDSGASGGEVAGGEVAGGETADSGASDGDIPGDGTAESVADDKVSEARASHDEISHDTISHDEVAHDRASDSAAFGSWASDHRASHGGLPGDGAHDDERTVGGLLGGAELFGGDASLAGDELALRRLLHGAVADLHPSDGALDHLRRAVPARRTRKRQAIVGFAAAAVLIGTAVPAFVHVANSGGLTADQAVNAGHGEQAQGGTGSETGVEGGQQTAGAPSGAASPSQGAAEGAGTPEQSEAGESGGAGTGSTPPEASQPDSSSPVCEAGQLGVSSAQAGGPDAEGKVYGTFRIANVSGKECVVSGGGSVGFQALGAADGSKISVVAHTAGDAASGLPDPSQESPALVLKPDNAYEVKFAWVPTETCPTVNPSPDPSTTTDGAGGTSAGATGSTGNGAEAEGTGTQLGTDGTPADGSVAVSHTAEAGAPQAATTIPNACAGTIYRTGVLDAS